MADENKTETTETAETPETVEVEVETEETEETSETGETEEESSGGGLTATQLKEAENLYKSLMSRETAGPMVRALMEHVGIRPENIRTERDAEKAEKSIKDVVKERLGKQYEFLADQLGDALEGAFEVFSKKSDGKLSQLAQNQMERDIESSMDKLRRETKGESKELETRMVALANEIPIGKMSVETYVRRLHAIATGEKGNRPLSGKPNPDKIRRNANDAPGRLRGTSAGSDFLGVKIPNKTLSLSESVKFAFDQQTKQR
jgi:hypothetical protein